MNEAISEPVNILVVDDDREIANGIKILLMKEGYTVYAVYDGLEALDMVLTRKISLVLLDVMMPRLDGLSAMQQIRQKQNIPIIILSAKSEDTDKIIGLTLGADDYVTKPYNPSELVARVKANLRRYISLGTRENDKDLIVNGGLVFDKRAKTVFVDGLDAHLTATELKIVELLMENIGMVFSAEEIYSRVWNDVSYAVENTVMVHIRRIREKIELSPKEPRYLKVVWGIGYKIEKQGRL